MGNKRVEVMGIAIKADTEMVSLTDLWKAIGGESRNRPKVWLATKESNDLLATLSKGQDSSLYLQVRKGSLGGTYAHWQIALAYAKWLSPELHLQVNDIYRRFQEADPSLAESIIDRTENVKDLVRIEARARNKMSNKTLNSTIHQHGGDSFTFSQTANVNNVAITGMTAAQIKAAHGLPKRKSAREALDTKDMIRMAYLELLESDSIEKRRCAGHNEILHTVRSVARGVRDLEAAHR